MAIIVTLIVALIVGGVAQIVVADLEMSRLVRWDAEALYLGQAALEHQVYALKGDKDAGAIPYTQYPVTLDQRGWYATSLTCLLNCPPALPPSARRWCILATGEIRRYNPDATFTVLHSRTIRADVDITYGGTSPLYGTPLRVTLLRWEEDLRASPACP